MRYKYGSMNDADDPEAPNTPPGAVFSTSSAPRNNARSVKSLQSFQLLS